MAIATNPALTGTADPANPKSAIPGGHANPYGGLQGVLDFLGGAGGINANQYGNMMAGHAGYGGYGVGGAHGALSGLSPWAVQYLMQNVMTKDAAAHTDTTGLTGDDLFKATLQNTMSQYAPSNYHLHSGVDLSFLTQLLSGGINTASGDHSAYRNKNYDASGFHAPPKHHGKH